MFPIPHPHNKERFMKRHSDGTASIWRTCTVAKETYSVDVKQKDLSEWQSGKLAQDAFPYLTADQREFLISNTTPKEWEQFFGKV